MDRRIRNGLSPEDAWNHTSIELAKCAESHCRSFIITRFVEVVTGLTTVSKQLHEVLLQLCELYAIYWVLQRLGDFLQVSYFIIIKLKLRYIFIYIFFNNLYA